MKKLLLAGVAVLLMATGAAHASPIYKWQCGQYTVILHGSSVGTPESERWSYVMFKPSFPPGQDVHFKWPHSGAPKPVDDPEEEDFAVFTGGKAFLNGKRCKDYVPGKTTIGE
jgi:hypothetical protein